MPHLGRKVEAAHNVDRIHQGASNGLVTPGEATTIRRATVVPASLDLLDPQPK